MRTTILKKGSKLGDLYHVCTLDAFVNHIIEDKDYNNGEGSEDNLHSSKKYTNDLLNTKDIVSFTRDSSFVVPTDTILDSSLIFQIVVDGNSLSNRHKITPYQDIKYTNGDFRLSEKEEVVLGAIPNFKSYIKEVYFDIKNLEELKNEDKDEIVSDIRKVIRYLNPIKCKRKYLPFDLDGYKKTLKQTFKINTLQELIAYIKNGYEPSIDDADTDELKEQFFDEDFEWWFRSELSEEEKLKKLEELLNEKSTVLTKNTKKFVNLLFQKSIYMIFDFSFDTIKFLLDHGADVNVKNKAGSTALYTACYVEDIELVKFLLDHGADKSINVKIKDSQWTPIFIACSNNNIELVKLLLEHGADINSKDRDDRTPLNIALMHGNSNDKLVKLLLDHGARIYSTKKDFVLACKKDNTELVKLLLDYGADVNSKDENDRTPLCEACKNNNTELAKLLIEHGADVNVKDEDGFTVLSTACFNNNMDMVKLLLDHGSDVNLKEDYHNIPPLYYACYNNNMDMVKLLLDHGADVNLIKSDKDGRPLWFYTLSKFKGNYKLIKLLLEHGAGKDLDADNLPDYITKDKQVEDLVLSYLNKNKGRNESIRLRKLYEL